MAARWSRLGLIGLVGLVVLAAGACGRRGPLEAPPGVEGQQPRPARSAGVGGVVPNVAVQAPRAPQEFGTPDADPDLPEVVTPPEILAVDPRTNQGLPGSTTLVSPDGPGARTRTDRPIPPPNRSFVLDPLL